MTCRVGSANLRRARHHRLRGEVVGKPPRERSIVGPCVAERGRERAEERRTRQAIVRGAHAVLDVPGTEAAHFEQERVMAADRCRDRLELGGEAGPLDRRIRVVKRSATSGLLANSRT